MPLSTSSHIEVAVSNRPQTIIGLYSPAPQSGKSTVARQLALQHDYELRPFAQPLRDMLTPLLATLGMSKHQIAYHLHQDKSAIIPELDCNARHLLRTIGTEWGRQLVCNDLWIKAWTASVQGRPRVVADDVRFLNEAHAIKLMGGQVWKIWRPGLQDTSGHPSEGGLDTWGGFDRLIVNDGDLAQLSRDVSFALR